MKYSGQVIDIETNEGIPAATIELWFNNVLLSRTIANGHGMFSFDVNGTPDQIRITSASYNSAAFPFDQVADDSYLPLERRVVEGENVIVTAIRRKPWILFALGFGLLVLADKNKR